MKKRFFHTGGQSTAELALVLPLVLLLLLGIMEMGRILASYLELQNAARDGARYAAVHRIVYTDPVKTYTLSHMVMLDQTKLTDPSYPDRFQYHTRSTVGPPPEAWVEVEVYYPLDINTPIISDIVGSPVDLHVKMAMRSE